MSLKKKSWQKNSLIKIKAGGTYVYRGSPGAVLCENPLPPTLTVLVAKWKGRRNINQFILYSYQGYAYRDDSQKSFTSAGNTHVFIVVTVVDAPGRSGALAEASFISSAIYIIEQDGPCALSKLRAAAHRHSHSTV